MHLTSFLASLPLLLVAITGTYASPAHEWQQGNDGAPGRPPPGYLGNYQGGGNPFPNRRPDHPQMNDDKVSNEPMINTYSPLCDQHVGMGGGDGANRTESVKMSDDTNGAIAFHSWVGTMHQGRAKADIKVNIDSHGILEIKIRNINDGVKFTNKIAVTPIFTGKAVYPAPTKWYLDTNKSPNCHYNIARKAEEIGSVYVRY